MPRPKNACPLPIHRHATDQRVSRIDQPAGKSQPIVRRVCGKQCNTTGSRGSTRSVGCRNSPRLWTKVGRGLSAGRSASTSWSAKPVPPGGFCRSPCAPRPTRGSPIRNTAPAAARSSAFRRSAAVWRADRQIGGESKCRSAATAASSPKSGTARGRRDSRTPTASRA